MMDMRNRVLIITSLNELIYEQTTARHRAASGSTSLKQMAGTYANLILALKAASNSVAQLLPEFQNQGFTTNDFSLIISCVT